MKMVVLETTKFFQRIIGLTFNGPGSHSVYVIVPALVTIPMVLLVVSISLNFFWSTKDTSNAWSTLPTTIAISVFIILYWYLVVKHRQYYSLFEDLQGIVGESVCGRRFLCVALAQLYVHLILCRNPSARQQKTLLGIAASHQIIG